MRSKSIELKRKIYDFVNDWRRTNGKAPTIRCIADGLSIAKTTAQRYLVEMADEDWGLTYSSKGIETREMNSENMMLSKAMIVGSIPCGEATSEEQFVEEYVNLPVSIFGNHHYDMYEAAAHYVGGGGYGVAVIDEQNAQQLDFKATLPYDSVWKNILEAASSDVVLKDILSMAQKNSAGELTKNRIVRVACECTVTNEGEIVQLVAKPKNETTLEISPRVRMFNLEEFTKIENDYFATHPQLLAE